MSLMLDLWRANLANHKILIEYSDLNSSFEFQLILLEGTAVGVRLSHASQRETSAYGSVTRR